MLKQTIHEVAADLMGLQEVAFGEGGQLEYLLGEEGVFLSFLAPTEVKYHTVNHPDPEARLDGNVVLVRNSKRIKVLEHTVFRVSEVRSAQRLKLQIDEKELVLVNTHLHHLLPDWEIRLD